MKKIRIEKLVKTYNKRNVVNGISIEINQSEVVGILGPNGAGKSTTFYMILGFKWRDIQPISNIVSLFFLISFIREFNFIIDSWIYPVLIVFIIIVWLVFRDFNKIKQATITFFNQPASAWFFSGFLVTYIFSRLFGRSSFWRLLYDENNYRLAKAATEEGIELLGVAIMLIAAIEFSITFIAFKRNLKS